MIWPYNENVNSYSNPAVEEYVVIQKVHVAFYLKCKAGYIIYPMIVLL
jgi:hypothetical protein